VKTATNARDSIMEEKKILDEKNIKLVEEIKTTKAEMEALKMEFALNVEQSFEKANDQALLLYSQIDLSEFPLSK